MSHEASGKGRQREGRTLRFGFGARSCHMQRSTAVQRVGRHVLNRFWCTRWRFGSSVSHYGPRVSVLSRVMSRATLTSAYSLPQTGSLSCAARTTSGVSYPAHGFKYISYHISSEFRTKYILNRVNRASGHHRSKAAQRSLAPGWQTLVAVWFIFMHVCASVFQLCTLLNTCNAARSATASRIFVLPSEINSRFRGIFACKLSD